MSSWLVCSASGSSSSSPWSIAHAQVPVVVGSKRVTSATADDHHDRDEADAARATAAPLVRARSANAEVERRSPFTHDDHEAHEQRAAEAREGPRRRDVVQRDADVGPREPAERHSGRAAPRGRPTPRR